MNIYETFGRQTEQFNELMGSWNQLLQILRDLRDGKLLPSQLVVTENGVEIHPVSTEDEG